MSKKPSRVRVLMMPYQDDDDRDPVGYAGPATVLTGLPRTIRRHELRLIVPLADSTIYEMEKRGDFPRRFNLTLRCVVWDLGRGRSMARAAAAGVLGGARKDCGRARCSSAQDASREDGG